eukprot:g3550.t1
MQKPKLTMKGQSPRVSPLHRRRKLVRTTKPQVKKKKMIRKRKGDTKSDASSMFPEGVYIPPLLLSHIHSSEERKKNVENAKEEKKRRENASLESTRRFHVNSYTIRTERTEYIPQTSTRLGASFNFANSPRGSPRGGGGGSKMNSNQNENQQDPTMDGNKNLACFVRTSPRKVVNISVRKHNFCNYSKHEKLRQAQRNAKYQPNIYKSTYDREREADRLSRMNFTGGKPFICHDHKALVAKREFAMEKMRIRPDGPYVESYRLLRRKNHRQKWMSPRGWT